MLPAPTVVSIVAYNLRVVDRPWMFAQENAKTIAGHWQTRSAANPNFFNGPIHLLEGWDISEGVFAGEFLRTDFASFLYWRDHGYNDPTVRDCFGSAVLRSSDGKIILGRQAPGHINSGLTYPPGGFIDQRDIRPDLSIDLSASVRREAREELGFEEQDFSVTPGAVLTFDGRALSIAIQLVSPRSSDQLLGAARRHLAAETDPELEHVLAVATSGELKDTAMPPFARALLEHLLPPE